MPKKEMTKLQQGEFITLGCFWGNLFLSVAKLLAGIIGHSQAMVADALHSASDVLATLAVYIGLLISKRPKNKLYPYGYGKIEPIMSIVVSVSLFLACIPVFKSSITSIVTGEFETPSVIAAVVAFISILVKEYMYRVTVKIGRELRSQSIIANAMDHRSDCYSAAGAFIGITAAMIGNQFHIGVLRYMDAVAAFVVGCIILKMAIEILIKAIHDIMDRSPSFEEIEEIRQIALSCEGVTSVEKIRARHVGRGLFVDIIINVSASLSVGEGHSIAAEVKKRILAEADITEEIIVHVQPDDLVKA